MIRLPQLSPTSLGNPAAPNVDVSSGTNAIASAIGQVSDAFTNISRDIARADNARKESEFRQTLAKDYADLQLEIQQLTDPAERLARTNDFLAARANSAAQPDFPPILQQKLRGYFDNFATEAQIRGAQDAAELTQKRARLALSNELDTATQYNDRTAFETALSTAREAFDLLPEEEDRLLMDFDRSAAETDFRILLEQDPQGALLDMEADGFSEAWPNIVPASIPRLKAEAKRLTQERRAQELDLIDTSIITGTFTPDDLEAAEYLTPKDIAQIRDGIERTDGPPTTPLHSAAWDKMFELQDKFNDPTISDEDFAAHWNDTRNEIYSAIPARYRGDFNQEFSYRSPANRSGGKPVTEKPDADIKSAANQRLKRAFDSGLLGEDEDSGFKRYQNLTVFVAQHLKNNPGQTWKDTYSFVDQLIAGEFENTDAPIIPDAPAPVSFDDRLNAILGLPPGPGTADANLLPPRE